MYFLLIVCYHVMHVTCMDHVDRRRGDAVTMHAYVRRECQEKLEAEGRLCYSPFLAMIILFIYYMCLYVFNCLSVYLIWD